MQEVPPTMPPASGMHQPFSAGPFRTPLRNAPRANPPSAPSIRKRAPSAAILAGESGNNLVLSRLQGWGFPAQASMPGVAYDLIADVEGLDMVRIQVKTQSRPKDQRCSFSLHRGNYYSKAGIFPYDRDDYDLAAFVCLSIGQVFFCVAPVHRISVRASWLRSPGIDRQTFDLALRTLEQRRHAEALSWLSAMAPDLPPTPASSAPQIAFAF